MFDNSVYELVNLGGGAENAARREDWETIAVCMPDEDYAFLHESAIIFFHDRLFAAWYQNSRRELMGETPIFWTYSDDGGRTFAPKVRLVKKPEADMLYCPPVFGIDGDRLYMFINRMYRLPDHIHSLDLYEYNGETEEFEFLWTLPLPFKLNTNAVRLDNGKLMLPGRIGEMDGLAETPACLISDSGRIDAEWRLVPMAADSSLPDGSRYIYPEQTVIAHGGDLTMFCRTDENVVPLLYRSKDFGESWEGPLRHTVPVSNSKIYAGTLSDGRDYLLANVFPGRRKLALFVRDGKNSLFRCAGLLQDGVNPLLPCDGEQWSYPAACEHGGRLYVIYTGEVDVRDGAARRGAFLTVINIGSI